MGQALALAQADQRSADIVTARASAATMSAAVTLVLAGSPAANEIRISLSPGGRSYLIESSNPLEVGGQICTHPDAKADQLSCAATAIAAFRFNGGASDDIVVIGRTVPVPTTLEGGAGNDVLIGGAGGEKLTRGPGDDRLVGRGGEDWLYGGAGEDRLVGGPGEDICIGGPAHDSAASCEVIEAMP